MSGRRYVLYGLLVFGMAVGASVSVGVAQPLFSERDLGAAMKAAGRNVGLAHTAIAASDFETAKMRVARTRERR